MTKIDVIIETSNTFKALNNSFFSIVEDVLEIQNDISIYVLADSIDKKVSEYLFEVQNLIGCSVEYKDISSFNQQNLTGDYILFVNEGDIIGEKTLVEAIKTIDNNSTADIIRIPLYSTENEFVRKINRQFPLSERIIDIRKDCEFTIFNLSGLIIKSDNFKKGIVEILNNKELAVIELINESHTMKLLPKFTSYSMYQDIDIEKITRTISNNNVKTIKKDLYIKSLEFFCMHLNSKISLDEKLVINETINEPSIVKRATYLSVLERNTYLYNNSNEFLDRDWLKFVCIDLVIKINDNINVSGYLSAPKFLKEFKLSIQEGIQNREIFCELEENSEVLSTYNFNFDLQKIENNKEMSIAFFLTVNEQNFLVDIESDIVNINKQINDYKVIIIKNKNDKFITVEKNHIKKQINERSFRKRVLNKLKNRAKKHKN